MLKHILAAAAALALAAPVAAQAQTVPSYAYAPQSDQQIRGRVTAFDGGYGLAVRDDNGYVDTIALHDGTIINPVGLTLEPGMIVNIVGYNAGNAFDANEIDTPYTFDDAIPYYGGHPWNFYGPSIDLSFFFGNTGWWHGGGRGVAYADRGRENDVNVRRNVTNVTNVRNVARQEAPRYDAAVAPRTREPIERTAAPRTRPAAGPARQTGGGRQDAPSRNHR